MHKPCAVIPVYNHERAVPAVVADLLRAGLPCVLVDDASSPACAEVLQQLATQADIHLVSLPVNQGKGGAVMAGLRAAAQLGFSHALQVDADGQHDDDGARHPARRTEHRQHRARHLRHQPRADQVQPGHADDVAALQFGDETHCGGSGFPRASMSLRSGL